MQLKLHKNRQIELLQPFSDWFGQTVEVGFYTTGRPIMVGNVTSDWELFAKSDPKTPIYVDAKQFSIKQWRYVNQTLTRSNVADR